MKRKICLVDLDLSTQTKSDLLSTEKNKILAQITIDSESFLRKIHFGRFKKLQIDVPLHELIYKAYLKTKDVRFFNELLWITDNKLLIDASKNIFYSNINIDGTYKFTYDKNLIKSLKQEHTRISDIDYSAMRNSKICLIGKPFHFFFAYYLLRRNNIEADIINIRYNQNNKNTKHSLTDNFVMRKIYRLYFWKKYIEYTCQSKKELDNIILQKQYDIGFHKLDFIIKESLYKQFRYGLVNDHWGALPLFKGRSTLLYTKLFGGIPVITNHFIDKRIDSGRIICFSKINNKFPKNNIYLKLANRIIKSFFIFFKYGTLNNIDNKKGVTFYEMHPWLKKYIKNELSGK